MDKTLYELSIYYDPDPQFPNIDNPIPRWTVEININKHYKIKYSPIILNFCYLDHTVAESCKNLCDDILKTFFSELKKHPKKISITDLTSKIANLYPVEMDYTSVKQTYK